MARGHFVEDECTAAHQRVEHAADCPGVGSRERHREVEPLGSGRGVGQRLALGKVTQRRLEMLSSRFFRLECGGDGFRGLAGSGEGRREPRLGFCVEGVASSEHPVSDGRRASVVIARGFEVASRNTKATVDHEGDRESRSVSSI